MRVDILNNKNFSSYKLILCGIPASRNAFRIFAAVAWAVIGWANASWSQNVNVTEEELISISNKIYINECSGKAEQLMSWNEGEQFLSLGIGHFIWYPSGVTGPFQESFPQFLDFLKTQGEDLPDWLSSFPPPSCPWNSREEFQAARETPRTRELQDLLVGTRILQAKFILQRLQQALPAMLEFASEEKREKIREKFWRVAGVPGGWYALADYVNFKGEGVKPEERYDGYGWGLLQALDEMNTAVADDLVLKEFSKAADFVLTRRVEHSPPERWEQRWLFGWKRRVATYSQ
jgi:hypothetical protein